jgi:hypothetical protein
LYRILFSSHRARLVASICELAPHITYITFVQSHANQRNFSDCAEHQNQKSAIVHDFQKNEKSHFCKRQKSFVLGKKESFENEIEATDTRQKCISAIMYTLKDLALLRRKMDINSNQGFWFLLEHYQTLCSFFLPLPNSYKERA